MLDQTLVDIISITLGAIGLIGAITKFDFPEAKRTVYGENLFRLKEDMINNYITWAFTLYAASGLLFQIIYNDILAYKIPSRLHSEGFYWIALAFSIVITVSLIPIIKRLTKWALKRRWQQEITQKAKDNFVLAKELSKEDKDNAENKRSVEIVAWLEELLEIKSPRRDLKSRLEFFESYFK